MLTAAKEPVLFVYLQGSRKQIADRLKVRIDHFMPAALLDSQFSTLEPPGAGENVLEVDIGPPVEAVVQSVLEGLSETAARE